MLYSECGAHSFPFPDTTTSRAIPSMTVYIIPKSSIGRICVVTISQSRPRVPFFNLRCLERETEFLSVCIKSKGKAPQSSIMVAPISFNTVARVLDSWETVRRMPDFEAKAGDLIFEKYVCSQCYLLVCIIVCATKQFGEPMHRACMVTL